MPRVIPFPIVETKTVNSLIVLELPIFPESTGATEWSFDHLVEVTDSCVQPSTQAHLGAPPRAVWHD